MVNGSYLGFFFLTLLVMFAYVGGSFDCSAALVIKGGQGRGKEQVKNKKVYTHPHIPAGESFLFEELPDLWTLGLRS